MSNELRKEKDQVEYLFLDLEWNQPCGTTELADREAAITKGELKAEAKNTLAEKKLPVSLADLLVYTDADSCNKSIATIEKVFQEAVEAAVQEKLKGGDPQKKAPESNKDLEAQIEKIMRGY